MQITRRTATYLCGAALVAGAFDSSRAQDISKLPVPEMHGGLPLMEALARRQSTRAFKNEPLSQQMLANLLWAAFGINRAEGEDRTAPSWRHSKETDIYVATANGVSVYDAKGNSLHRVLQGDVRKKTSSMVFVGEAPAVLIYVADRGRMAQAPAEEQLLNAHVDSGIIAQNVYLFAASAGLGTVVLGSVNRAALAQTLGLRPDQIVTFSQPVGYPK